MILSSKIRTTIFKGLHFLGIRSPFSLWNRNSIPIVTFHRVNEVFDHLTQPLHPIEFERIIRSFCRYYNIYPMSVLFQKQFSDPKGLIITVDDALSEFYDLMYPVFRKFDVPATLFVPTHSVENEIQLWNYKVAEWMLNKEPNKKLTIGKRNMIIGSSLKEYLHLIKIISSDPDNLEDNLKIFDSNKRKLTTPMTWNQIREVKENGITIGSHFHKHLCLPALDIKDIRSEIAMSTRLIYENLGLSTKLFAFPMGEFDQRVMKCLESVNAFGFSTENKRMTFPFGGGNCVPRFNISDRSFEEIDLRITGFHQLFKH